MASEPLQPEPARPAGAADPSLPEIPGYAVHAMIGRGATGVVYRATQLAVDRPVAIKVLHPELSARKKAVARLQREARMTARLAHPGIVSAIDMGHTAGGLWWYAMELVEGPSLAEMLKEKRKIGERHALRLFIPLCEALQHAFEAGVVHRDIKPANILIDASGRARLVDLGLAFTETDPLLTGSGAGTLGTPHYVSPEQARNPEAADVRSDIWSLGATLYHALCGRPPFGGDSVAEILSGVLYARVQDPVEVEPTVSKGMALVLRKCLARMPERRYQQPRELLADLERLRERRPVAVQKQGLDPLRREHDPLARWLSIGGVALAVALTVALVIWRPWNRGADTSADLRAPLYYGPLENIADEVTSGTNPARFAQGLVKLDQLKPELPPEHEPRFAEVKRELLAGLRQAGEGFKTGFQKRFRLYLEGGDLIAAADLLRAPDEEIRRELGLGPQMQSQVEHVKNELRLTNLQNEYERAEQATSDQTVELLKKHYRDVVLPAADEHIAAGRWIDARGLLAHEPREVLQTLVTRRLPEEVQSDVLRRIGDLVQEWREQRDELWRDLDKSLAAWVETRADELETGLVERDPDASSQALITGFEAELARRGVLREQVLTAVSDKAQSQLELRFPELVKLEERLLKEDAQHEFVRLYRNARDLWTQREYTELQRLWRAAEQEPWLAPVHDKIRLERREAELLAGLLERAASGVATAKNVLIGTIPRGPLKGEEPLHGGFQVGSGAGATRYNLRGATNRLPPEGVEHLAGIAQEPTEIREPLDRLIRALFRDREGAPEVAAKTFDSGPLPGGEDAELVQAFRQRMNRTQAELDQVEQRRLEFATDEYHNIKRTTAEASVRQPKEVLRQIDELLLSYSELAFVREKRDELLAIKDRLEHPERPTPEQAVNTAFAPSDLDIKGRRATLAFDFGAEITRWERGDWQALSEGWMAKAAFSEDALLAVEHWPRLELAAPLDLDAPMTIEVTIAQPADSSTLGRFELSVAGWHVLIVGPESAGRPFRLLIGGAGELESILEAARRGQGDELKSGLPRDKEHSLRVELTNTRSKIDIFLDGQRVGGTVGLRSSTESSETRALVVRSLERVYLRRVTLEAGLAQ